MVEIDNVNEIKHDIVREALKYLKISRPMEISSMADLSAGTGMGSSSSYTVALLKGLNTMIRRHITTKELAEEACKIEIDQVGKPIGKQDQYAAAYGGIIQLDIDRLGNTTVTPIQIEEEVIYELEHRLLMFYTKIERDANIILGEQSTKAKNNDTVAIESMHAIKEIGFKIKSLKDSKRLSQIIAKENDINISYNTIRRFFGVVKNVQASKFTLDTLSKFKENRLKGVTGNYVG